MFSPNKAGRLFAQLVLICRVTYDLCSPRWWFVQREVAKAGHFDGTLFSGCSFPQNSWFGKARSAFCVVLLPFICYHYEATKWTKCWSSALLTGKCLGSVRKCVIVPFFRLSLVPFDFLRESNGKGTCMIRRPDYGQLGPARKIQNPSGILALENAVRISYNARSPGFYRAASRYPNVAYCWKSREVTKYYGRIFLRTFCGWRTPSHAQKTMSCSYGLHIQKMQTNCNVFHRLGREARTRVWNVRLLEWGKQT